MVPFGWCGVVFLGGGVEAYGDLVSGLGRRAGVGEVDDAFHGDGGDGVEQVEVEQSGQHLARGELGGLPSGFGPDLHGDGAAAVFEVPASYPFDGDEPLRAVCGHFEVGGQVAFGVGVDPLFDGGFEVEAHCCFTALSSVLCLALSSIAFTLPSEPCPVVASATLPLGVLTWVAAS